MSLAGRWPSICIVLRLLPSDRDTIARDCRDVPRDCLMEVLIKWLQRCYDTTRYGPPTWRMLVAAVANSVGGDNPGLAREIARNHPGEDIYTYMYLITLHVHVCSGVKQLVLSFCYLSVFLTLSSEKVLNLRNEHNSNIEKDNNTTYAYQTEGGGAVHGFSSAQFSP